MFEQTLIYFAVRFAVRRIAQFGHDTNWELVKKDWDEWVMEHVPGTFMDQEAVNLANATLDGIKAICADTKDLSELFDKAMSKDYEGAEGILLQLLKMTVGGKVAAVLSAA